ncbi:MAG: polysaccharide deacetylase family protein [Gemmataceae bacterium]|nr:polysaccharide deacetylase family protein [Gemmataceae bacterium]
MAAKAFVKNCYCAVWKYSGAMALQERLARWVGRSPLSILLFHRVTDAIPPDGLTVTTRWFRSFCRLLRAKFHVVSLGEFVRIVRGTEKPLPRTVAITFDDCYRDNLDAAHVLAEYRLPACFFVPSQYVGTDHVFEWDQGLPRMPNLTWDEVRAIVRLGHEIGSHTVSHADLATLSVEQTRYELVESKKTIEEQIQRPVRWFAYPYGGRENIHLERLPLVFEAGYEACFSGYGGFVDPRLRYPIIPRQPMPQFRSLLNLEMHLTGCLDWVYSLKRRVGIIAVP